MDPYDAILGFDWLQAHSPMECDWKNKTISFSEKGRIIQLHGLQDPPLQLSAISAQKTYNATKGNDVWAFVLLDQAPPPSLSQLNQQRSQSCYTPTVMSFMILRSYHRSVLMIMPFPCYQGQS